MTDITKTDDTEPATDESGDRDEKAGKTPDASLQARISQLEADISTRDGELVAIKDSLGVAVARYRAAVAATASGVPEDLLTGETVEEIDASLERARRIVSRVREQIESETAAGRVPAGAPPRALPDMSALSPAEKIVHGLTRERR